MLFQREGCKPIRNPSEAQLRRALTQTKSSFASLTADDGSYLQVAGGPGLFAIEKREVNGAHFRASQRKAVVRFEDGTTLSFSGGELRMKQNEWFLIDQVIRLLLAFMQKDADPPAVEWQLLTQHFAYAR